MLAIRFLHYLGVAMWIGGGIAALYLIMSVQVESLAQRTVFLVRIARLYSRVVIFGVLLVLGSGILWNMSLVSARTVESPPVPVAYWVMVVTGFLGGAIALFVAMPNALKLCRIPSTEYEELAPAIERLKMKFYLAAHASTTFAGLSLFASVAAT